MNNGICHSYDTFCRFDMAMQLNNHVYNNDMKKQTIETPDMRFWDSAKEPEVKICAKSGCDEEGLYKAPRSSRDVRDYIWFCLDHVREYNKSWNYFDGMDEVNMEDAIRNSTTWERPSWKFGTASGQTSARSWQAQFDDPLGMLGGGEKANRQPENPSLSADERKAWSVFGLTPCNDQDKVKKRYKELAKTHHPDANGGSRQAEDRLKTINWAYSILKKHFA